MKNKVKILPLLLALVLILGLTAGCSQLGNKPESSSSPAVTPSPSGAVTEASPSGEPATDWSKLPLVDKPVTLTAWWPTSNVNITDPNETLPFKEGAKRTNVNWTFTVPANGSEGEQFNLLIASQEYPDLIKGFASYYNKGLDNAVTEDIITPLEDYLYCMPDIDKWRNSSDLIKKSLTTDGGHFAGIPMFLIGSEDHIAQGAYSGYGVRSDWLDQLGMKVPQTYDEMGTLLKGIKDAGLCQYPFELWPNADTYAIMGGYNITSILPSFFGPAGGWILKDGKVSYSLAEANFKEYIQMLNDWFDAGYFQPDYYTVNTYWNNALTKASNNELGVFNYMYTWLDLFRNTAIDKTFDIAAIPPLRKSTSDKIHVRSTSSGASISACISAQSKNVELACGFWNYFFSDDGIILGNYGVEGQTFDYKDNKPVWNDNYYALLKDHDSSYAQGMSFIFLGPGFRWWDRELQGVNETAVGFLKVWDANDVTDSEYFYPNDASMTGDESTQYANIMSDVGTYISENLTQFIIGDKDMSEWDAFIKQVEGMGIADAIAIKQAAYDRYMSR